MFRLRHTAVIVFAIPGIAAIAPKFTAHLKTLHFQIFANGNTIKS